MLKKYSLRNYNFRLIVYVCILTIIGIMIIGSAEKSVQNKQILGFVLGIIVMVTVSLMDYSYLLKFKWVYYFGTIGLLLMVKFMGKTVGGAQRWFKIPIIGIQFQPSELAKIVLILIIADFFNRYHEKINSLKTLVMSFVIIVPPLLLILKQPDTSTTLLILFILIVLLFIAGLSYKIILTVMGVAIPVGIIGISYILRHADELISAKHYQVKRIMGWLDPTNPKYSDYAMQQRNSIVAIGSGQLWGKGLNNSVATSVKNADYILEPQTDFIFAVTGEELGFVGCLVVIVLILLIVLECILVARKAKDLTGQLICCGMAALIGFQTIINVSVASGLMPNTGIPLPFISYGLTSLVSIYLGIGFVLNVGLQPKKY